ncbi:MAG: IS630 transposase-related protein [Defluviitaleaceae bacterium]|nr:IS630 transposase-related protein [Defluviitaleaceae bacterium]
MNFIAKGNSIQKAHEKFEVGTTTIKEWKKLKAETGRLEKRPLNRQPKKICPEKLRAYIATNPDSYLEKSRKSLTVQNKQYFTRSGG